MLTVRSNGEDNLKISAALHQKQKILLDTAPLIYLVEANPSYIDIVVAIFALIDSGQLLSITTPISLAECLVHPILQMDHSLVNTYISQITRGKNSTFISIGSEVAYEAATLRAKYKIQLPDALQLASGIDTGCDAFLTNDRQLAQVTEINVIVIDDLEIG